MSNYTLLNRTWSVSDPDDYYTLLRTKWQILIHCCKAGRCKYRFHNKDIDTPKHGMYRLHRNIWSHSKQKQYNSLHLRTNTYSFSSLCILLRSYVCHLRWQFYPALRKYLYLCYLLTFHNRCVTDYRSIPLTDWKLRGNIQQ